MHEFLINPFVHGALIGWASAFGLDLAAFKASNSWGEFFEKFNIKTASFMWVKGIIFGGLANAGLGYLFGL